MDLNYLQPEAEDKLVQSRTGLSEDLTRVLVKVASDIRYQFNQLKAPLDTDTEVKWSEELAYIHFAGIVIDQEILLDLDDRCSSRQAWYNTDEPVAVFGLLYEVTDSAMGFICNALLRWVDA